MAVAAAAPAPGMTAPGQIAVAGRTFGDDPTYTVPPGLGMGMIGPNMPGVIPGMTPGAPTASGSLATATGLTFAPPPGPQNAATIPGGGAYPTPAQVPNVAMPTDTTAGTFARAKDTAGQNLTGTLKAIQENAAARGLSGSTAEQSNVNSAILGAGQTVADASTAADTAYAQEEEQAAEAGYAGGVTQRGQDISSLDTQRGQDITATEDANALAAQEWQDQNSDTLAAGRLGLDSTNAQYSQLSALGSLLQKVTPTAPAPAAPASRPTVGSTVGWY